MISAKSASRLRMISTRHSNYDIHLCFDCVSSYIVIMMSDLFFHDYPTWFNYVFKLLKGLLKWHSWLAWISNRTDSTSIEVLSIWRIWSWRYMYFNFHYWKVTFSDMNCFYFILKKALFSIRRNERQQERWKTIRYFWLLFSGHGLPYWRGQAGWLIAVLLAGLLKLAVKGTFSGRCEEK